MLKIYVDPGKANTKYGVNINGMMSLRHFPSSLSEVNPNDLVSNEDLAVFNNKYYEISDRNGHSLDSNNSKLSYLHELYVYIAIAKMLHELGEIDNPQIELVVTCPVHEFRDKRDEYARTYAGKQIGIEVQGQYILFSIMKVSVHFEGKGSNFFHLKNANQNTLLIDHGGQNVTYVEFDGVKPIRGRNFVDNNGCLRMIDRVASKMSEGGHVFSPKNVLEFKQGLRAGANQDFYIHFENEALGILRQVKNQIEKMQINPALTTIVISGGGSMLLKEFYKSVLSEYNVEFGHFYDNIKGLIQLDSVT